jgi:L-aspartate oxidase
VRFDRDAQGGLALGREAAHQHSRILHANGDQTGAEIMRALLAAARRTPSITFVQAAALKILVHEGAVAGVLTTQGVLPADRVLLATGGIGGLFQHSTNPETAIGAGLMLAMAAGATLKNLEFIQFHPTALDIGGGWLPLISEAVRGEGAKLIDERGDAFMNGQDLAARDVVARAIFVHQEAGHRVYLDARPLGEKFAARFPGITAICARAGIDPAREPIPVRPAAHYHMGGVAVDTQGRTSVEGLFAAGEVACTGLHGANRLASNSLLECVVLGRTCAGRILADQAPLPPPLPAWDESQVEDADEQVVIAHNWDELRLLMWNYVGIVRTTKRLERALHRIKLLRGETLDYYANFRVNRDLLELRNLVVCAELIVRSALRRHESRGLHFSRDFPNALPVSFPTVLTRQAKSDR